MEAHEKCAVVSSNDCPLPNLSSKRLFMPGLDTRFNDNKKRKLGNGIERIKSHLSHSISTEEREILRVEAEKEEIERQKLFNLAAYRRSKEFHPIELPHNCTVPQPFMLRTDQNPCAFDHAAEERCINARPIFKARPMPRFGDPPILTRSDKKLTIPRDFGFSSPVHNRHVNMECMHSAPNKLHSSCDFTPGSYLFESPAFKAKEMPDFSNPFTPLKNFTPTKFQSFNLKTEERGSSKKKVFEQRLDQQNLQEENSRYFKAQPLPSFTPPSLKKSERYPTTPSPFVLATERRSLERLTPVSPISNLNFKAKPMPDFSQPFFPINKNTEITQPMDIELNSDRRAEERALFDENIREKERREKWMREQEERERKARELQEVQLIRKQSEFKARPMPGFYNGNNENSDPNFKNFDSSQTSFMDTEPSYTQDEEMTDAV